MEHILVSQDSILAGGCYLLSNSHLASISRSDLRIPTYFVRPASIRVYNTSRIRYATRVNFDVACNMAFHNYPHDVQTCEIKLESFGYTNRQMKFNWMEGMVYVFNGNISRLYIELFSFLC